MQYKIGDLAVYPAHGVGIIQNIESKAINGGKTSSFYVLRILDTGVTILIPTTNVVQVGLRRIMDVKTVKTIYRMLQERDVDVDHQPWNRRYRQYMDKLKSGSPFEIAEVFRNLLRLKGEKVLSFGERKMLDTARSLLVKEISLAKSVSEDAVEADLRRFLNF